MSCTNVLQALATNPLGDPMGRPLRASVDWRFDFASTRERTSECNAEGGAKPRLSRSTDGRARRGWGGARAP